MSTILLAEDDPDIRHLVSFKLGRGGFEVVSVEDGFAALREAHRRPPDLAILDVRMPKMSGIEVCRELRGGPHTAQVPIIMLTARARPQDLEQAYAAGATDYVVKPFSPRELLERVESVLARVGH
jgi:two-component system phosphate regulon response regulator PhoB